MQYMLREGEIIYSAKAIREFAERAGFRPSRYKLVSMICDVCGEPFLEGEAMREITAIGHMHQNCSAPPA